MQVGVKNLSLYFTGSLEILHAVYPEESYKILSAEAEHPEEDATLRFAQGFGSE